MISNKDSTIANFLKFKKTTRNEIFNVIKFVQIKMIIRYDNKHKILNLVEKMYLKLTKIEKIRYYISKSFSLFIKKIDFYKILKKINSLIYKLKLSLNMLKVYSIIFMIHLEQAKSNSFN